MMPIHDWSRVPSGMFHDFHQSWSIYIKNALNAGLLPDGFSALVEQKTGVVETDVLAIDEWDSEDSLSISKRGGAAVMTSPDAKIVSKSTREFYAQKANRVVVQQRLGKTIAVIELVSPGNKDSKRAIKSFVEKSQEFLARGVHLLVVDLFPPTKRDPHGIHREIWDAFDDGEHPFEFPERKDRIAVAYEVGDSETTAYVEPLAVGDALPAMPLFLDAGIHVKVPLEETYRTTWELLPASLRKIVETGVMPTNPRD